VSWDKRRIFQGATGVQTCALGPKTFENEGTTPFEKPENINLATEHHIPVTRVHQQFSFSFCVQEMFLDVDVMSKVFIYQPSFDLQ
jgi:hypothetical protein